MRYKVVDITNNHYTLEDCERGIGFSWEWNDDMLEDEV